MKSSVFFNGGENMKPLNPRDYQATNWEWKDFSFNMHIYKLVEMFTIRKFKEIDFVNKNWPNDPRVVNHLQIGWSGLKRI
jgi:hypothetical protein